MPVLILILWVFALVLFILAALNVPSPKLNLGWAGAAFATIAVLIAHGIP